MHLQLFSKADDGSVDDLFGCELLLLLQIDCLFSLETLAILSAIRLDTTRLQLSLKFLEVYEATAVFVKFQKNELRLFLRDVFIEAPQKLEKF